MLVLLLLGWLLITFFFPRAVLIDGSRKKKDSGIELDFSLPDLLLTAPCRSHTLGDIPLRLFLFLLFPFFISFTTTQNHIQLSTPS
jgi:hypothetical protein